MEIKNEPQEMTEKQFQAWCEWKKWCSIWRVRDPQPSAEEIENGIENDLPADLREEHCRYLTEFVCRCMDKKISAWYRKYTDKKSAPDIMAENQKSQRDEYISVFDSWMKSEKKEKVEGFEKNSYKDFLFYLLARSKDTPGQVIMGKIFGSKGYINTIIKQYLMETEMLDKGPRNGVQINPLNKTSLSESRETEDGTERSFTETIGKDDENIFADNEAVGKFYKSMTREDKIVYTAIAYRVAPSNEQLLSLLHCRKEHSGTLFKKLLARLEEYVAGNDLNFLKELLFCVIRDLEPEKELHSFLLDIGAISDDREGDAK